MFTNFITCLLFPLAAFSGYTQIQQNEETMSSEDQQSTQIQTVDSINQFYTASVIYLDVNSTKDKETTENEFKTIIVKR